MVVVNKGSLTAVSEYEEQRRRRALQLKSEQPTKRTSAGLRDALFDEIDALRRGDGDPQRATAVARLATNIIAAAKIEMEFRKAGIPESEGLKPLELGAIEHEPEKPNG